MKKITILLLVVCCYTSVFAQKSFEPKILILSPGHTSFDPVLKNQVEQANDTLIKETSGAQDAFLQQQDKLKQEPENIRLMAQSGVDFLKKTDVFKQLSSYTQSYLSYRFYEKFPNCLILLKDEPSKENINDLQKIANEQDVPYIVNYPDISLYLHNGKTYCKLRAQLYDRASNTLSVDKEYTGDWNNPGFEFSCKQGTIGCTINNAMSFAMPDIIYQIASNNPTLIREKQLAIERGKFIGSTLYPAGYNPALVKEVIPSTDLSIQTANIYQCLYSADSTKFIAFFISNIDKKDAKPLLANRSDKNVTILTSKDIKDPGYLDQKPQTYAYIVKGIKYNDKWYYEKAEVTYFNADNLTEGKVQYLNNLRGWNYFGENTASPSLDFWDGKLFEKIADKRKDPDWDKNKDIWESDERENRDYIGMYELVADQLKQESATADSLFKAKLYNTFLLPYYKRQIDHNLNGFWKLAENSDYVSLIYPKDKHVAINPVEVTDHEGNRVLRYFVILTGTNEIYEWTLVKPVILKKGEYSDDPINNAISALTQWNLAYQTLDDNNFWIEKVLAKDGGKYIYLKKLSE